MKLFKYLCCFNNIETENLASCVQTMQDLGEINACYTQSVENLTQKDNTLTQKQYETKETKQQQTTTLKQHVVLHSENLEAKDLTYNTKKISRYEKKRRPIKVKKGYQQTFFQKDQDLPLKQKHSDKVCIQQKQNNNTNNIIEKDNCLYFNDNELHIAQPIIQLVQNKQCETKDYLEYLSVSELDNLAKTIYFMYCIICKDLQQHCEQENFYNVDKIVNNLNLQNLGFKRKYNKKSLKENYCTREILNLPVILEKDSIYKPCLYFYFYDSDRFVENSSYAVLEIVIKKIILNDNKEKIDKKYIKYIYKGLCSEIFTKLEEYKNFLKDNSFEKFDKIKQLVLNIEKQNKKTAQAYGKMSENLLGFIGFIKENLFS